MEIREMGRDECLRVLARASLARLACAREGQPYVVPVSLAYGAGSGCLYGFTTPGQKVEWMRANPRVCVEVDEVAAPDRWVSVIAFGTYEELAEPAGGDGARPRAPDRPRQSAEVGLAGPGGEHHCHSGSGGTEEDDGRELARRALVAHPVWWEPGCTAWVVRADRDPADPFVSVYYRIRIDRVTGREARRGAEEATSPAVPIPVAGGSGGVT